MSDRTSLRRHGLYRLGAPHLLAPVCTQSSGKYREAHLTLSFQPRIHVWTCPDLKPKPVWGPSAHVAAHASPAAPALLGQRHLEHRQVGLGRPGRGASGIRPQKPLLLSRGSLQRQRKLAREEDRCRGRAEKPHQHIFITLLYCGPFSTAPQLCGYGGGQEPPTLHANGGAARGERSWLLSPFIWDFEERFRLR